MDKSELKTTQQFTTTASEMLNGIWDDVATLSNEVVEPFFGAGDLYSAAPALFQNKNWTIFDIDTTANKTKLKIVQRDTLLNPPNLLDKLVITNPPYLARNKSKNKTIFDKYETNDLYKASIKMLINEKAIGGILIIPLNFLTDTNTQKLRKEFSDHYHIKTVRIFNKPMFEDTNYQTVAFSFIKKALSNQSISKLEIIDKLGNKTTQKVDLTNGKRLFDQEYQIFKQKPKYKFVRLVKDQKLTDSKIIPLVFELTDKNAHNFTIKATKALPFYGKITDRTKQSVAISKKVWKTDNFDNLDWETVAKEYNKTLNKIRKSTNNLIFTNFRDVGRKRMSFAESNHLLSSIIEKDLQKKTAH